VRAVPIDGPHRVSALVGETREPLETRSDASLLRELARTGGDDPFQVLVQRYRDRVFRLIASVLGPGRESDVEEVAQELFLKVFRKVDLFRGDSEFSTWLFRIARNLAVDRRRQPSFLRPLVGDRDLDSLPAPNRSSNPELLAAAEERRGRVLERIAGLPEPQRTVVYLHYWLDSEIAEIAQMLDMNTQTVKSHLFRARRRLARDMGDLGADHD